MAIRKRSWKSAAGDKKEAWVFDYVDQAGKRHIKTFDRKKDAEGYATTTRFEITKGTHTPDSQSITIGEAGDQWVATAIQNGLEEATIAAYRQHLRLHIKPHLARVKLSQLSAPMVREFEDRLLKGEPAPGEERGAPRSPAMVRKIRTSLSSLVADAQERGQVARNAVRELRSSRKRGKERQAEKRQRGKLKVGVDIPTPQEVKAIVEAASDKWRPFLLTAIFAGLRASELRGLRWQDINFKRSELNVRQRADRYGKIGRPKSAAGERAIPLPPALVLTLKVWKLACPTSDLDLVFPTSTGRIEHHTNIVHRSMAPTQIAAKVTKPARDENGERIVVAKYTGLHSLRHFFASWCINRKIDGGLELPPKVVQERLGHSSIVMTMDTYGHLFPRGDDSAELAAAEKALLG